MHLVLQRMDLKQEYNYEKIEELINNLVLSKIITQTEAEAIDINKIINFIKSEFAKNIASAKMIYKEQPCYIDIPAKELCNVDVDEKILVQGIVDLYFIDKDGNLILVDYKTDKVKDENELKEKYKNQLKIYKQALEISLNKNVYKTYIYSLYLNKEILINLD